MVNFIAVAIAAAAIAAAGYFIFYKKKATATATGGTIQSTGWTLQYSPNMPTAVPKDASGNFIIDFPSKDGVHYVVEKAPALAIGKTVTMVFSVSGAGQLKCSDTTDPGNPHVRFYMQRSGDNMSGAGAYQQYRYWSSPYVNMVPGDYTLLTAPLTADQWGDVFGDNGSLHPAEFQACVANAAVIGFTFGGSFAGHGLYAVNGNVRFILKNYTIQ